MNRGTLTLQAGRIFGGERLGSLGGYLSLWPAAPTPNPALPATAAGVTAYLTPAAFGPVTTTTTSSFPNRPNS